MSGDPALTGEFDRSIKRVYVGLVAVLILFSVWALIVMMK